MVGTRLCDTPVRSSILPD
ncbi:hypothetical protein F383_39011 [Gossypium arboreum]|uniref:Uncharacterized protein n=1 Tax=Gossypium arboreum TaxID=29729 RepID=A0A0B0MIJ8_GOSAR|nr:hypothetical protein F383_39011 [Gossypium arboreum]